MMARGLVRTFLRVDWRHYLVTTHESFPHITELLLHNVEAALIRHRCELQLQSNLQAGDLAIYLSHDIHIVATYVFENLV